MKNVIATIAAVILTGLLSANCYARQPNMVAIDESHFPDGEFRETISYECDENNDGFLSTIELANVSILCMPDSAISSLKGIEYFKHLKSLEITSMELTSLDCSNNPSLEELWCGNCCLQSLNVSGCSNLRLLVCDYNELTELDVSDCGKLEMLSCIWNKLSIINIDGCSSLSHLECDQNNLSEIRIGTCPLLIDVYQNGSMCETNAVTEEWWDDEVHPYYTYFLGENTDPDSEFEYSGDMSFDSGVTINTNPLYEETGDYITTAFTASSKKIGIAKISLKKGFDFINKDSSQFDFDLALTAVTLSAQVYKSAKGMKTEELLYELGYDYADFKNANSSFGHPGACFGYKQLEDGKNIFAAVVRGTDTTDDLIDVWTDIQDGSMSMFRVSGEYIEIQLENFMEEAIRETGKTKAELQQEDNYFFFAGHSLGGAIANYLSVNKDVMKYVNNDKGKIYTYTFEAPHTCEHLLWTEPESESNAFNYKVVGDAVTNMPPYPGSTTYGEDVWIHVSQLDDDVFNRLFRKSKGKTLRIVTSVDGHGDIFGLHDTCLGLVFVIQNGPHGWGGAGGGGGGSGR